MGNIWSSVVPKCICTFSLQSPQSTTHPLFAALSQNDHDASLPLASRASHPLHQADGVLLRVEADDEVHLPNVQTLLTDAGRHQRVEASMAKPVHDLPNKRCEINLFRAQNLMILKCLVHVPLEQKCLNLWYIHQGESPQKALCKEEAELEGDW